MKGERLQPSDSDLQKLGARIAEGATDVDQVWAMTSPAIGHRGGVASADEDPPPSPPRPRRPGWSGCSTGPSTAGAGHDQSAIAGSNLYHQASPGDAAAYKPCGQNPGHDQCTVGENYAHNTALIGYSRYPGYCPQARLCELIWYLYPCVNVIKCKSQVQTPKTNISAAR
jgi:hypothetical protein